MQFFFQYKTSSIGMSAMFYLQFQCYYFKQVQRIVMFLFIQTEIKLILFVNCSCLNLFQSNMREYFKSHYPKSEHTLH